MALLGGLPIFFIYCGCLWTLLERILDFVELSTWEMVTEERGLERDQVVVGEKQCPLLEMVAAGVLDHSRSVEIELPEVLPVDSGIAHGSCIQCLFGSQALCEVELEEPSVLGILSRTVQVIGVSQIDCIERFLLELR